MPAQRPDGSTGDSHPLPREEVVAMVQTYLYGGLTEHDPSQPRLAPDCFRHENGWDTGRTPAPILEHFPAMTMCLGVRDLRWTIEGNEAFVRFEQLTSPDFGGSKSVAEYFRAGPGGIEEIAPVFPYGRWMKNALGRPAAFPMEPRPAVARTGMAAETVAAGEQLIAALAAGRPGDGLRAPDVTLTENGVLAARGVEATTAALSGAPWDALGDVGVIQWIAEGAEAVCRFEAGDREATIVVAALHVRVYGGAVREIDVHWGPGPSDALFAEFEAR